MSHNNTKHHLKVAPHPHNFVSLPSWIFFFKVLLFIYLKGRVTESYRFFHLLAYSPNVLNSQGWAKLKPGARNSTQISHLNSRNPSTCAIHILLYSRNISRKLDQKQSWDSTQHSRLNTATQDAGVPSQGLICCTKTPEPLFGYFYSSLELYQFSVPSDSWPEKNHSIIQRTLILKMFKCAICQEKKLLYCESQSHFICWWIQIST